MSAAANKAGMLRLIEAFNQPDGAGLEALFAEGALHFSPLVAGRSRESYRKAIHGLRLSFPDLTVTPGHVFADDEYGCVRWTATGTHNGPFFGLAPTGKRVMVTGLIMCAWREGRIAQLVSEWNALQLYEQLGLVSPMLTRK